MLPFYVISSYAINSVQNRIVESIVSKFDNYSENDDWFDIHVNTNNLIEFKNTKNAIRNRYILINTGELIEKFNSCNNIDSLGIYMFLNFVNNNSSYDSNTILQNGVNFGFSGKATLLNDFMFIDASTSIGIVQNKITKSNDLSFTNLDNNKRSFTSHIANLSIKSGFNIKFLDYLNIEPNILVSFNVVGNNNDKNINKFINIIPTFKVSINTVNSWKIGFTFRNTNTISFLASNKFIIANSYLEDTKKSKSNIELELNVEKKIMNDALTIYGNLDLSKISTSRFNFNLGFKFDF